MSSMKRREFITLLGGAAAAWPFAAHAQQPTMPVVGFLYAGSPGPSTHLVAAFRRGLEEAGYVEGQNVAIEYRWAEGQYDQLPAQAADLARRQVALIVAAPTPAAVAAKTASSTIPIVFLTAGDPVQLGLVASFNRPGGNATGVTEFGARLTAKRVELLHELVPKATVIALLVNPTNSSIAESATTDAMAAVHAFGLQLFVVNASTAGELDLAFATLVQQRIGALVVSTDAFFNSKRELIVALAARHAIARIHRRRRLGKLCTQAGR